MATKDKLKTLIAQNKTNQVIAELLALTKDTDLSDEVVQQSGKFAKYEQEKRLGTHSKEELDISLSRVNNALLSIIDELPISSEQSPQKTMNTNTKDATNTNEEETPKKSLWQYILAAGVIIGILAGLAELTGYSLRDLFGEASIPKTSSVTVLVHGKEGKDKLVLPNRGIVYLVYGDAKIPEQINNKGIAVFNQIPEHFFSPEAKVELLFEDPKKEPYRVAIRDTLYDLKLQTYIPLMVILEGMEQISGIVEDFETGKPIDSAMVRIFGTETYSNQFGEFTLNIPEDKRKQFITLRAFKKGYKNWELNDIPTTTEQEIAIPLKKE